MSNSHPPTDTDSKLAEILAKDDTAIMLDELRELFGPNIDVDSRFTIAQVLTVMEHSFGQGKAHIEMLHRAEVEAAKRLARKSSCAGDDEVEAERTLIEAVDRWIVYRQPSMATAKEHRERDIQEREARFRLANAAAEWAYHKRDPRTVVEAAWETEQQQAEDDAEDDYWRRRAEEEGQP